MRSLLCLNSLYEICSRFYFNVDFFLYTNHLIICAFIISTISGSPCMCIVFLLDFFLCQLVKVLYFNCYCIFILFSLYLTSFFNRFPSLLCSLFKIYFVSCSFSFLLLFPKPLQNCAFLLHHVFLYLLYFNLHHYYIIIDYNCI